MNGDVSVSSFFDGSNGKNKGSVAPATYMLLVTGEAIGPVCRRGGSRGRCGSAGGVRVIVVVARIWGGGIGERDRRTGGPPSMVRMRVRVVVPMVTAIHVPMKGFLGRRLLNGLQGQFWLRHHLGVHYPGDHLCRSH
jgi:hypothetical protein